MKNTQTPMKYDRDVEALPDSEGTPVKVGDWVRDPAGHEWQVRELTPKQTYDNRRVATGEMDLDHSAVRVVSYGSDYICRHVEGLIWDGRTETGFSLDRVTKLDLSPEGVQRLELDRVEIVLGNIERAQATLTARHRAAMSEHRRLSPRIPEREGRAGVNREEETIPVLPEPTTAQKALIVAAQAEGLTVVGPTDPRTGTEGVVVAHGLTSKKLAPFETPRFGLCPSGRRHTILTLEQ